MDMNLNVNVNQVIHPKYQELFNYVFQDIGDPSARKMHVLEIHV